jgi:hypothetical protein
MCCAEPDIPKALLGHAAISIPKDEIKLFFLDSEVFHVAK